MLLFCRDQYYDKKETDTKPGQYNPTPVSQRRFSRRKTSEDFRFTFGTEQITQLGGYPLFEREFEYHDLRRRVHRILRKTRAANGFSSPEITIWEVVQKMLGCRRLYHANKYRRDPLLEKFFGIRGLPDDATVGRYNKSFTPPENEKLANLNESVTDRVFSDARSQVRWHPHSGEENPFEGDGPAKLEVTLDVDGTGLTVYGDQEEAERGFDFREKDSPLYRLLSTFVGGLRLWIDFKLIPGNYSLRGNGREMVKRASRRLPESVEVGAIRGDSALYSGDDIQAWGEEGKTIAISARKKNNLMKKIGFDGEEVPHDEFEGNRAYLGHVQLAYNLMISTTINRLPTGVNRYQRERLVRELVKIPARLLREEGGWVISLPDWWPYKKRARTVLKTNPPPG